jgi:hypothetical protein
MKADTEVDGPTSEGYRVSALHLLESGAVAEAQVYATLALAMAVEEKNQIEAI